MPFRGSVRAWILLALLPAGLAAQGTFEGVITMRGDPAAGAGDRTLWIKGDRMRVEMRDPRGGMGTMIRDGQGRLLALVDARRLYYVLSSGMAARLALPRFTATGRRETVAGYACEYYTAQDRNGARPDRQACITTSLGFMPLGPAGPIAPTDDGALRAQFRTGFLILKIEDASGRVVSEVTRIELTSVSDAQFALPPGYTELKLPYGAPQPPR